MSVSVPMFSDVVKMRFLIEAVMKKRGNRLSSVPHSEALATAYCR